MTRVAFATYRSAPSITDDDQHVVRALAAYDVEVDAVPWDAAVAWRAYAAVLPRSTWDFHHRLPEFRRWLDDLAALGVATLNPPRLLRWNLTKEYLRSLDSVGIDIVPTRWITGASAHTLAEIVTQAGWAGAVVVKPIVSASAYGTWVATGVDPVEDERRYRTALMESAHGLMLQPFLPGVRANGEWSLVFIGGVFSHAVLKRPADDDFRVQEAHGGSSVAAQPDAELVAAAERAVRAAAACTQLTPADILYARVDGVMHEGRFLLMELEAVEPALFFALAPHGATRMASCIALALRPSTGRTS